MILHVLDRQQQIINRQLAPGHGQAWRFADRSALHPNGHDGIDLGEVRGEPIHCPLDGEVRGMGLATLGGLWIRVRHDLHRTGLVNWVYQTGYCHLEAYAQGVREGMPVRAGDVIGYVGSTGHSTGAHLHFQLWLSDGIPGKVDPLPYLYEMQQEQKQLI